MRSLIVRLNANAYVPQKVFRVGRCFWVLLLLFHPIAFAQQPVIRDDAPANSDPAKRQFLTAAGLYAQRKYPESAAAFESILRDFPNHALAPVACANRATALEKSIQLESAASAFQNCAQHYPSDQYVSYWQLRAGALLEKVGHLQQAAEIYRALVSSAPANSEATYRLGRTLHELGKNGESREILRRFIEWKATDDTSKAMRLVGLLELREMIQVDPKEKDTLRKVDQIIEEENPKLPPIRDEIFNVSRKLRDGTSTARKALS